MDQEKWEKFSKQTNKEKCLKHWEWVRDHPGYYKDDFLLKILI